MLEIIQAEQKEMRIGATQSLLVDSFPVALAKQGHRFKACVAQELANHGYCSTNMSITYLYVVEKLYFYGVKVHVIGRRQAGTLPSPEYIGVTPASEYDGKVFDQIRPKLMNEEVFGDKAYQRPDAKEIEKKQCLIVRTPVKKQKGQTYLDADEQWLSTAVSSVRQPIHHV